MTFLYYIMESTVDSYEKNKNYIYIHSVFFFHNCPQLIPLCNIEISLFIMSFFESMLLNYANPCRKCFIYIYIYIYIVFLLIVQLIPLHNIAAFINICRFLNQCC